MVYVPMTPVDKNPEDIMEGLRNSVADVESLILAYGAREAGSGHETGTSKIAGRHERAKRIHLVSVLRGVQHELDRVRHLVGKDAETWTTCIQLVDQALAGEDR